MLALLLAFTLSLDAGDRARLVTAPVGTLPHPDLLRIRLGLRPDINALATIIILSVAIGRRDRGVPDCAQQRWRPPKSAPGDGGHMSATGEEHYPQD